MKLACILAVLALGACASVATSAGVPAIAGASTASAPLGALTIGSFNPARGGIESLKASDLAGLRAAIKKMFHPRFKYAGKLTAKFLGSVDVIVIGVAKTVSTEIKPLGSREQSALVGFARHGGTVIVFADNSDFQNADDSVLVPFGLSSTGKLDGDQTATWVGNVSQNPLASGPAGVSQQLDTYYPGWFSNLGSAQDLADLPVSGQPVAAYLAAGALGSGSGAVIFFADSSLMLDGTRSKNDETAILNALSLAR